MAQPPHAPLTTQLALMETSKNTFSTLHPPQKMGNPLNIAYGGYALALACKAAHLCVPPGYHLYSMQGNYLGPAYTDRVLSVRVKEVRQTRTFATRSVEVVQTQEKGGEEERVCLLALADFMITSSTGDLLAYDRKPTEKWPGWRDCKTQEDVFQTLVDEGRVERKLVDVHAKGFSLLRDLYTQRIPATAVFARNLYGLAKEVDNGQQDLLPAERMTADWFCSKEVLSTHIDHVTSLVFAIDTAIAFLPLSFNNLWFDNVDAVSSLDFSLRFFTHHVDVNRWLLRELTAPVAGEGRSFGEAWVWDEQGRAVCSMSQQSILRPRRGKL